MTCSVYSSNNNAFVKFITVIIFDSNQIKMSKSKDQKKEDKKKPLKSKDEKRAEKRDKKPKYD